MNISYYPGSVYRTLSDIARQLMGQGAKPAYNRAGILATKYQNSAFRSSQVWTLQALAFPRGTLRKQNVLRTPTDVYHSPDIFFKV